MFWEPGARDAGLGCAWKGGGARQPLPLGWGAHTRTTGSLSSRVWAAPKPFVFRLREKQSPCANNDLSNKRRAICYGGRGAVSG